MSFPHVDFRSVLYFLSITTYILNIICDFSCIAVCFIHELGRSLPWQPDLTIGRAALAADLIRWLSLHVSSEAAADSDSGGVTVKVTDSDSFSSLSESRSSCQ